MEKNQTETVIHELDSEPANSNSITQFIIIIIIALVIGTASGFGVSKIKKISIGGGSKQGLSNSKVVSSAGISDKKTFKDNAEGVLKEGGLDGEGSYHLERKAGDASQNAYLTSSTVDLSQFVDRRVRVWGETFKGEKAGWLMDVGLVEVLQ